MEIKHISENHDVVVLSPEENAAVDEALAIIEQRAELEYQPFDARAREVTEWWLCGMLREKTPADLLKVAREAPFASSKKTEWIGYATPVEVSYT